MGKNRKVPNRKLILEQLSRKCIKYFGENYESWTWDDSNNSWDDPIIKAAIELPKTTIHGKLVYTDPFIATSGGNIKSLVLAAENAYAWIEHNEHKLINNK